jgi:hypothetical protein
VSPPLYALPLLLSKNICGRGVSRAHAEFICAVHTPPPRYVLRSAGNHNRTAARGESGERRLCDDVQVALSAISVAGVSVRRGEVGGLQMQLNFLLLREGRVALAKDAWLGGAGGGGHCTCSGQRGAAHTCVRAAAMQAAEDDSAA